MSNQISRWVRCGGARVGGRIVVPGLARSGRASLSVRTHAVVWPWLFAGALALGCSADRQGVGAGGESGASEEAHATSAPSLVDSAEAQAVVQAIRARFRLKPRGPAAEGAAGLPRVFPFDRPPMAREALARSHVAHVDRDGPWLRPRLPDGARRGVIHRADVSLPARADGAFHLVDVDSGVTVDVALADASDVAAEVADGFIVYRRGHASGADIVHRVTAEGTEDYLAFEHAPDLQELRYQIALGDKVAGLRLVANTLEMLDAGGAPRLRVAPPYVVDAAGMRHEASVAVSGCVYEDDPRMPWGQAVRAPGERICEVRIAWGVEMTYPLLVDPVWTATGSMMTARRLHTASLLTIGANVGRVLVVGGDDGNNSVASAEIYDPVTSTWSAAQPMGNDRIWHTASVLTTGVSMGKILVTGGGLANAELYDPATGTWNPASNMSVQRSFHTASLLNDGTVLVAGGSSPSGSSSAEVYNPATDSWGTPSIMSIGRRNHAASVLSSGKVLVTGGYVLNSPSLLSAEAYDPATNAWSAASNMIEARSSHAATLLNDGRVFVTGGYTGSGYAMSAEAYDPATNTWTSVLGGGGFKYDHTATLLSDGRVLVAGGPGDISDVVIYDPTVNNWTGPFAMITPRYQHTATLLGSGGVLVAGGDDGITPVVASAELFALLPQGTACAQMNECLSGFCVDGYCCDTACNAGPCDACSTALGAMTDGTCSLLTGTACNDGDACTQTDTCQNGTCTGANPVPCTALDQCHDVGTCNPATGVCSNPNKPNGSGCNDSNACTQTDSCQNGTCTGANPVTCAALDQCHDVGTCNPATGVCSNPNKANGSGCNDGYACTQADICQNGTCTGTLVTCSALDQCHDVGNCNSFTGVCPNPYKANGTFCDDSDACTKLDSCQNGTCVGVNPVNCGALDECHDAGMCDSATGVCTNPVKPDGSACENGGMCMGGVCNSGSGGAGGTGGGGAAANADSGTFYSCSAGNRVPADPWFGFAAVWGALALATRARRRRG